MQMLHTLVTMALVMQADCFGTLPPSETFDYIIVGSGPGGAGALLGLIEHDPSANVLLLERGKPAYAIAERWGSRRNHWGDCRLCRRRGRKHLYGQ